jgi:MFS family permease
MGRTGLYLALWIGLGTVIGYFFGPLSLKFGRTRVYKSGFIGASLSLLLLGSSVKTAWAVLGLILFGTFLFLLYPALQSYVGNTVPSQNQPQAFSLFSNIQMISGAVISLLAGVISDEFGIASPFLVMGVLGMMASFYYLVSRMMVNSSQTSDSFPL